jgi:hypothetical protein
VLDFPQVLRRYDARMWCAMAHCYEKLEKVDDAIKCETELKRQLTPAKKPRSVERLGREPVVPPADGPWARRAQAAPALARVCLTAQLG